ncbi:MAG: T9SS type A sorting domain-containing protein [Dysgonamonadaceae bacterium]|jgi:hypothetical protein|nr:T9SS type A sorting domain-containing protein [Dysgonamonadaceae bacterium]
MKRLLLLSCISAFAALNVMAQDTPAAGQQFRIVNGSGLYLTCDPEWNADGWNLWFIDSLYTADVAVKYVIPYERGGDEIDLHTTPAKQIFTLLNPDPNDPEIWAIETGDGQYMSIDTRNTWDMTITGSAGGVISVDDPGAQLFFEDQGYGIYMMRFKGITTHIASDATSEGISIGKYSDGWEYASRSFTYRDKDAKETAYWFFEKVTGSGINSPKATQNLTVFPGIVKETLNINVEYGTKVTVYSLAGAKVIETAINGNLNVSSLTSGVYVVSTPSGAKAKFVKQ